MTTTTQTRDGLNFHLRGQLSIVRDLAMVAMCVALIAAFLAQVWSAPTPTSLSVAPNTTSLVQRGA